MQAGRCSVLPVELQAEIFALVRESFSGASAWMLLSGVCRLWRRIALEHHELWAASDPIYHPYLFSLHISRSVNAPLDLQHRSVMKEECSFFERRLSKPSPYASINLLLASVNTHRLRSLSLLLHSADMNILNASSFFSREFPILESLRLENREEHALQLCTTRLFTMTPRLKELSLVDIELLGTADLPPSIQRITLKRVSLSTHASLLALLANCPHLHQVIMEDVVHISDRHISSSNPAEMNDGMKHHISSLQSMHLRGSSLDAWHLLQDMTLPSSAQVNLVLCIQEPDSLFDHIRDILAATTEWAPDTRIIRRTDELGQEMLERIHPDGRKALTIRFAFLEPTEGFNAAMAEIAVQERELN
jgi:hypothetical protein